MTDESNTNRDWTDILVAAALGAAAMYLLDPDKGRRRRAIARDKIASLAAQAGDFAGRASRDFAHRVDGVRAQVRQVAHRGDTPDDLQLIERVRSRMGRVVSHPHAIHVGALQGRVTVSGPILADEAHELLDVVKSVPGVCDVDDHLVVFDQAGSISSLQGTPSRPPSADFLHQNWTPALRMAALVAGMVLALGGMRAHTLKGILLAGAGLALGARGATNKTTITPRPIRRRNGSQQRVPTA